VLGTKCADPTGLPQTSKPSGRVADHELQTSVLPFRDRPRVRHWGKLEPPRGQMALIEARIVVPARPGEERTCRAS